jgi:YesN/AraC family two-component response regulator
MIVKKGEEVYTLDQGEALLTKPGEIFQFKTCENAQYIWIKFRGKTAEALASLPAIIKMDGTPLLNVVAHFSKDDVSEEYVVGELYRIVSGLLQAQVQKRDYVRAIKSLIHDHPKGNISVQEIATALNLNRKYMTGLFHRSTGLSIREYILQRRATNACILLARGYSVGECATMTGYANIYTFSKAFKKATGKVPSDYIKESRKGISRKTRVKFSRAEKKD